jgi:hypothetical protein
MQFNDPHPVSCLSCGAVEEHPVADLLAMRARCTACMAPFESIGRQMRSGLVESATFAGKVDIAMSLETALAISISDVELDAVKRGIDFVSLIKAKASSRGAGGLAELVRAAVAAAVRSEISLEHLYLPLNKLFAGSVSWESDSALSA